MHCWHFDFAAFKSLIKCNIMSSKNIYSFSPSLRLFCYVNFNFQRTISTFVRIQSLMSLFLKRNYFLILNESFESYLNVLSAFYKTTAFTCCTRLLDQLPMALASFAFDLFLEQLVFFDSCSFARVTDIACTSNFLSTAITTIANLFSLYTNIHRNSTLLYTFFKTQDNISVKVCSVKHSLY